MNRPLPAFVGFMFVLASVMMAFEQGWAEEPIIEQIEADIDVVSEPGQSEEHQHTVNAIEDDELSEVDVPSVVDTTSRSAAEKVDVETETALEHAEKHLVPGFVCPMHSDITGDKPGNCPVCGMELVALSSLEGAEEAGEPKIERPAQTANSAEPTPPPIEAKTESALEHAQKHLDPTYVCPMHPQIVRAKFGSCPICGMDLVAVAPTHVADELPVVGVSSRIVQRLGVRTEKAVQRTFWRRIDTVGYVEYDRTKLVDVYGPADGNIQNLTLSSEGERVKKGQFLFELASPMLSAYYNKTYAKLDGVVSYLNIIEGEFVTPRTKVLTIADLSSVWVLADIFEAQSDWVKLGQAVEVRLPNKPDRIWEGEVEYIYPNMDPETRTLKARMRFDNKDEVLKPNMLAEVTIFGGPKRDVLAVPREALIETGKQQRVVVALGEGRFQPRVVTVGVERGEWVEIIDGVETGENIVVSGQFLIDSESSLQASFARMVGAAAEEKH